MRKEKKPKTPRRIGGGIDPAILDNARVQMGPRVELRTLTLPPVAEEKDPILDLSTAKTAMVETAKAFRADPTQDNQTAAKLAREAWERAEREHFFSLPQDVAVKQVQAKALAMEAKAEELKKQWQAKGFEKLEHQAQGRGDKLAKCDEDRAKLEGQAALALHEAARYHSLIGHVLSNRNAPSPLDFSEEMDVLDFGACQRPDGSVYGTSGQCRKGRPVSLKPSEGMPVAAKKAMERGLKAREVKEIADIVREKHGVKQIKHGRGLTEAQQLLGEAIQKKKAPEDPIKSLPTDTRGVKQPSLQAQVEAAKAAGRAQAAKDMAARDGNTRNAQAAARAAAAPKIDVVKRPGGGVHDVQVNGQNVGHMIKYPGDPRYYVKVGEEVKQVAGLGAARAAARGMAIGQAQKLAQQQAAQKPDSLYGAWPTDRLQKQQRFLRENGAGAPRLDAELARRGIGGKAVGAQTGAPAKLNDVTKAKTDSYLGGISTQELKAMAKMETGTRRAERLAAELNRRGEPGYTTAAAPLIAKQKAEREREAFPKVPAGPKSEKKLKDDYDDAQSKTLGSGAMGTVKAVKGPPPGIVKSGMIGQYEAAALKRLEGTGVAPTFHGQSITSKPQEVGFGLGGHVTEARGILGMSRAAGKPSEDIVGVRGSSPRNPQLAGRMVDEYIRVRSVIHKNGVAHNDMHQGNFFFDKKTGRGSVVDFGLSQVSPKAALAEAMGTHRGGSYDDVGDWQSNRFIGNMSGGRAVSSNYDRFVANRKAVEAEMKLNHPQDYKDVFKDGGIRNDNSTILDGIRMSDQQAQAYINRLYEGIE